MTRAGQLLIEPCSADDDRLNQWTDAAAAALSPATEVRNRGIDELRHLGFEVLAGSAPPPPPPPAPASSGGPPVGSPPAAMTLVAVSSVVCLCAAIMLTARPGRGGPICGRLTVKGTPCANPRKSCRINHTAVERAHGRGPTRPIRQARARRANKAMRAAGKASNRNLPAARPGDARRAAATLKRASVVDRAGGRSGYTPPTPMQVAALLRANEDGFTVNPRHIDARPRDPVSGVCVTFDNTALSWDTSTLGAAFEPDGTPHPELTDRIGIWLNDCQPALRAGNCWIGGWYNPANGKMELNLTAVFRSEHREAAEQFGRFQGQIAVYDLDIAAAGTGNPEVPVGSGGETAWTPPPPPRRRRLLRTR